MKKSMPFRRAAPGAIGCCLWMFASALFFLNAAGKEPNRKFTVDDLLAIQRVSDTQVSPDGKLIVYAIKIPNLEKNNAVSHLWIVPIQGGKSRQLTNHEKGESRPRWSPDSKTIAFLSSRSGSQQIWSIPVDGGEARQMTSISTEADNQIWSKTGRFLAFTSDVWTDLQGGDSAQK
jgi:Tol biopolymer transport system component